MRFFLECQNAIEDRLVMKTSMTQENAARILARFRAVAAAPGGTDMELARTLQSRFATTAWVMVLLAAVFLSTSYRDWTTNVLLCLGMLVFSAYAGWQAWRCSQIRALFEERAPKNLADIKF
jgi:hypothetical protein